ncbi:MAG: gamma carbonic anhydrase family protein [Firmicutes bacterium]|nr:gamma carbonic anhydrase family protein [Bacillota bacterium]
MNRYAVGDKEPKVAQSSFVADGARLIGDVQIGEGASVWYNAVLRADLDRIVLGRASNVQDNAVFHTDPGYPVTIGEHVTIGHAAIVHGATVEDGALIGMGAILLNGATIGEHAMVGAGALVPEGMKVPPRTLVLGVPAKVIRPLSAEEVAKIDAGAAEYERLAAQARQATAEEAE